MYFLRWSFMKKMKSYLQQNYFWNKKERLASIINKFITLRIDSLPYKMIVSQKTLWRKTITSWYKETENYFESRWLCFKFFDVPIYCIIYAMAFFLKLMPPLNNCRHLLIVNKYGCNSEITYVIIDYTIRKMIWVNLWYDFQELTNSAILSKNHILDWSMMVKFQPRFHALKAYVLLTREFYHVSV